MSATLCKPAGSTFSPHNILQNSRGSSRSGKEVKDLNVFAKCKIKETIKGCHRNMHVMSNFEDLSISSSNKSIQSIISNTSVENSDDNSHKLAHKK
eukprot:4627222-Ditylum_brightwellii.AAC.1